jgi:hypothetical protein
MVDGLCTCSPPLLGRQAADSPLDLNPRLKAAKPLQSCNPSRGKGEFVIKHSNSLRHY